jgi:predicted nucleotidyltransferase
MKAPPRLVEITPEGKIVAALIEGPKSYMELRSATRLSDRWLSKKLKELSSSGLVEHHEKRYRLKNPTEIIDADPVFAQYLQRRASLKAKARLIAEEISRNDGVVAVILFGSVAKEQATGDSDIDLLVVTEVDLEKQLTSAVYSLMFKHDVPVETLFFTYEDLIINLQAKTAFSLGLLEGYQVLYDRGGVENLLSIKKKEIREEWFFDEEAQTWIQKKLKPTFKPPKTI